MLADGRWTSDQDILAYFTRPTRSVNHRAIAEVRTGSKYAAVEPATADQLTAFLQSWPDIDPETGLSVEGDELLIKAREAMIAAVHIFNSAGLTFRAELFIVTAVIAWTYLSHAWFKHEGIDYRYKEKKVDGETVVKTPRGAEKFWELRRCLRERRCPIERGAKDNLDFLLDLRDEIEHRSTNRIDNAISAKLQACCINFNDAIKRLFGVQYGLERRLPIALQFVTFSPDQRQLLKEVISLPHNIEAMLKDFEDGMTQEQQDDPRYAFRVFMVGRTAGHASNADLAVELVPPESGLAKRLNVLIKGVEKKKYLPSQIVKAMQADGWDRFTMRAHTLLWKKLEAKDLKKGYGMIVAGRAWYWYDSWLDRVRKECAKHPRLYRTNPPDTVDRNSTQSGGASVGSNPSASHASTVSHQRRSDVVTAGFASAGRGPIGAFGPPDDDKIQ